MAKQLYINIERRGEWNKVDPRDAKIMALTTALKDQSETTSDKATTDKKPDGRMTDDEFFTWRKTFKGKTAMCKGKEWTWCPHHKKEGHYNGLYYNNHTPETHDAWKAGGRRGKGNTTPAAPAKTKAKLGISEALKTALCNNFCVSEEDLNKIIDSMESKN